MSVIENFLNEILPEEGLTCIAVKLPGGGMRQEFFSTKALAAQLIEDKAVRGNDVYYGCATYSRRERKQEAVQAVKAIWLDLDCGEKKPYSSLEDAVKHLRSFAKQHSLPNPKIVSSGNGVHAYWVLKEAVHPSDWLPVAQALKQACTSFGLRADPARTADSASLLRPVNTINSKGLRLVQQIDAGQPCEFEELKARIGAIGTPERIHKGGINDEFGVTTPATANALLIAQQCAQIHAFESGEHLTEPEWRNAIGVLKFTVGGETLIHKWSAQDERYDREQTAKKISGWTTAPTTCGTFSALNDKCNGCPSKGKITSPIVIGLGKPESKPESNPESNPEPLEEVEAAVLKLNEKYCYIKGIGIYSLNNRKLLRTDIFRQDIASDKIQVGKKLVQLSEVWMSHPSRKTFEGFTFSPGKKQIDGNKFNLWNGWGFEPVLGDVGMWNRHLDNVFGNDKYNRTWFEQWLAYPLQYPGMKLYSACLFWSSKQGVGKTLLAETVGKIYGENFYTLGAGNITARFNTWAANKQLVLVEEVNNSSSRINNEKLKHLITGNDIEIEGKGAEPYVVDNHMNFMFTSNSPTAVYIERHDRRFFIWEVQEKPSETFFQSFVQWRENGGIAALMHHLMNVDLTGFNPKATPPVTVFKNDVIESNHSDVERWLIDIRDGEPLPTWNGDVIKSSTLTGIYNETHKGRPVSSTAMGNALRNVIGDGYKTRNINCRDGVNRRLYIIRNLDVWKNATPAQLVEAYAKALSLV